MIKEAHVKMRLKRSQYLTHRHQISSYWMVINSYTRVQNEEYVPTVLVRPSQAMETVLYDSVLLYFGRIKQDTRLCQVK